mmetsp:Transcript_3705/g.8542  ORF Transcript_3705/g.8542 Transcript_3705/m.8542 type:complete len:824 (-) Transcript_3705:105-2576(-)
MSSLDAFNLDDMFAEGGDALFGFDQDLMGGMDDIVDQERKGGNNGNAALPAAAPPPVMPPGTGPKGRGPRTKKSNPMIPEEEQTKKGRNKRKSKAAALALDDDIELLEDGPRKKRKASMKKQQGGKAELDIGGKSKKKKGAAAQAKQSKAGFVPSVPAVGQFGARATSSKFKKPKKKGTPAGEDPTPPMTTLQNLSSSAVVRQMPKQEPTFCGLHPSKVTFYPFMESVPPEPNLKNKKVYPGFDKIASTFTNSMVKPLEKLEEDEFTQGLNMESPVFALIRETFEAISDKERQNFNDEKQQALLKTIPHMRKYISKYDRQKVIADVYALLGLLGRQYNFLQTSLENMRAWCQTEFTPQDYKATYEISEPSRTSKHQRWKKHVIKVHVTCPGHREPGPLTAILPQSAVIVHTPVVPEPTVATTAPPAASGPGSGANATTASSSASTKKKSKAKPGTTTSTPPVPAAPKTYAECSPQERRSMIAERVTEIASELQEKHRQEQLKQDSGSKKPFTVTEDETLSTQRMWDFTEIKGFHKIPSSSLLSMESLHIRPNKVVLSDPAKIRGWNERQQQHPQQQYLHPQHLQQQMEMGKVPLPQHAGQGVAPPVPSPETEPSMGDMEKKRQDEEGEKIRISSNSLFDRLQSLLVEEDDDENDIAEDEADSDSDDDSSSKGDDESLGFLDEADEDEDITDPTQAPNLPVVDLSSLSLEERTFIHLSKMGLIGSSLYPKAHLVLSSAEEHSDEHDFCNVIGSMTEDLSEITAKNNARVQFLESAVISMDLPNAKQLEDRQNSLINKCQNLIKRNKEKAKKSNSKKKDDLNLPW